VETFLQGHQICERRYEWIAFLQGMPSHKLAQEMLVELERAEAAPRMRKRKAEPAADPHAAAQQLPSAEAPAAPQPLLRSSSQELLGPSCNLRDQLAHLASNASDLMFGHGCCLGQSGEDLSSGRESGRESRDTVHTHNTSSSDCWEQPALQPPGTPCSTAARPYPTTVVPPLPEVAAWDLTQNEVDDFFLDSELAAVMEEELVSGHAIGTALVD